MIHNQDISDLDIDVYTNIHVNKNDKMVNYFNAHSYEINFDSLYSRHLVKENKLE